MSVMHVDYFNKSIILINDNITVSSHYHYECELLYLINGTYRVISGGKTYEMNPGDIFFAFPFTDHEYVNLGKNEALIAIFSPSMLNAFTDTLLSMRPIEPVININRFHPYFDKLLLHLCELYQSKSNVQIVESLLTAAVGEIISTTKLSPCSTANNSIERIIRYCINHLDTPELTADSAARELGLSRTYLSRIISSNMNGGFTYLIHSLRIEKAINMLRNTGLSITEIAYDCGFSSQRTFNRVFRDVTGITPGEYRNCSLCF